MKRLKLKKIDLIISNIVLLFSFFVCQEGLSQEKTGYFLSFENTLELQDYFSYKKDGTILISGHRGGRERGFPENSIEVMENVLSQIPAFFEIDPRLTKDSIIVLMHDDTIDRTTTGKGKLSDYTFEELRSFNLKDNEGNITPYKIPTLADVITWSKGKTVINLDKKDVPMWMIVDMVKKYNAENHVMLTVHTGAQARYYYDKLPNIMLSVFVRNSKEFEDMSICGVPWENMIAYVGTTINDDNRDIVRTLHEYGVRCMISFASTHDKLISPLERERAYKEEIKKNPDIIESDLPVEVSTIVQSKLLNENIRNLDK